MDVNEPDSLSSSSSSFSTSNNTNNNNNNNNNTKNTYNKSGSRPWQKTLLPVKSFEWDNYLNFCNAVVAPAHCFNQNDCIPSNEFRLKQKLEITSPDNRDFIHLATVVGIMGPRLQLRLDGCDTSNDIFELVDSDVINPIGTCKKKNKYFAAPLRFRKDAAVYGSFCKQILKDADHAPPECFKKSPEKPEKNFFVPGMKLEAVDIKHPSNICPATIKSVDHNDVEIHLDGWDSTNDYKCPYFSRNLFPVGWCKKSGLILQFPGKKAEYQEKANQSDGSITELNPETSNSNKNNEAKTPSSSSSSLPFITNNIDQSSILNQNEICSSLNGAEVLESATILINNNDNNNIATFSNHNDNDLNDSLIRSPINFNNNSDINHSQNYIAVQVANKRNFDQMNDNYMPDTSVTPMNGLMNGRTTIEPEYDDNEYDVLPKKSIVKRWSCEEVIEFLNSRFPDTHRFENNFRYSEIDGQAFLLLNNEVNMRYLNLKLGFSLKVADIIYKINSASPY